MGQAALAGLQEPAVVSPSATRKAQVFSVWFLVGLCIFNIGAVAPAWRTWSYFLNGIPLFLLIVSALNGREDPQALELPTKIKTTEQPWAPTPSSDKRTGSN
jgi:hypothetical protein